LRDGSLIGVDGAALYSIERAAGMTPLSPTAQQYLATSMQKQARYQGIAHTLLLLALLAASASCIAAICRSFLAYRQSRAGNPNAC
jgi:hypothetical protein